MKTAVDLRAPISGEVIELNIQLEEQPSLLNEDPYGTGWICKLKMSDSSELDGLLHAQAYMQLIVV